MKKKSADDIIHELSIEYKFGVAIPCYTDKVIKMKEILAAYEDEIENLRRNLEATNDEVNRLREEQLKTARKDPCVHRYANVCLRGGRECTVPLCKKGKDDNEYISNVLKAILEYIGRED